MTDHLAYFSEKKNVGGRRSLLPEILGQLAPVRAKTQCCHSSASAVTPSEKKVQLTLIGSSLHAFQWA